MSAFRILAIEQSEDVRQQLRRALEGGEFELQEVESGREGLAVAKEQVPDLILLDLLLPDVNGFDLIRRLKATRATRRIPVVLLTSLVRPVTVLRGAGSWPVEFLSKPIDAERLLAVIERVRGAGATIARLRELGKVARSSGVKVIDGALTGRLLHRQLAGELESVRHKGVPVAWLRLEVDMLRGACTRVDRRARRDLVHQIAEQIRGATRVEDLVALDDNAAFIVLLAGVSPLAAQRVGEKIRAAVGKIAVPLDGLKISLESRIEITHWAAASSSEATAPEVTQLVLAPRRVSQHTA